jgi:hypothetical protein
MTSIGRETSAVPPRPPILTEADVARRMLVFAGLQEALAALEIRSVVARNHRLVLRRNIGLYAQSGLTDLKLYIFALDGTETATTDGTTYYLASGTEYPASEPDATAMAIRHFNQAAYHA